MKAFGFTPDRNSLYKKLVQVLCLIAVIISILTFGERWLGNWIEPSGELTSRFVIILSSVLLGFISIISLIYLHFRSLFYEIHEDRVIVHTGVITRSVIHVPFQMITDIKVRRSPLDRLFKLGSIDIQTAAKDEHHRATVSLVGLRNFREVYDLVSSSMRQNRIFTMVMQEEDKQVLNESELLKNLLTEMRDIRMLLQDQNTYQNHRR
jgi:membrane protein YdbS with pleckstrin-like domain